MSFGKFFEALKAGAQVTFENAWKKLRFIIADVIFAVVAGGIVFIISKKIIVTLIAGIVGAIIATPSLRVFDHCKAAVKYADKHDVDMMDAWKNTTAM